MFMWELFFATLILYRGIQISLRDRYYYLIWTLISSAILCIATYLVTSQLFVYNTLSPLTIVMIISISILLGIAFQITAPMTVDKKRRIILIPGRYINLIPTFSLLIINYSLAYLRFTQKEFFTTQSDERQYLLIAFTTIMGTWVVMNLCICYRYTRCKSTPIIHLRNKSK